MGAGQPKGGRGPPMEVPEHFGSGFPGRRKDPCSYHLTLSARGQGTCAMHQGQGGTVPC